LYAVTSLDFLWHQELIFNDIDDEKISHNVTVRVYQPPEHQFTTKPRPVVVFYAGGGWVTGNLDTEDHLCRTICGRADVVVVSVDYRKFPAIQFPENIQDSYDGFQWVKPFIAS
jgi:acetyl esterase/lipase